VISGEAEAGPFGRCSPLSGSANPLRPAPTRTRSATKHDYRDAQATAERERPRSPLRAAGEKVSMLAIRWG
jgi:hypothetical protein